MSKGGTCHLFRGFPDTLGIEPRQFDDLLGHPGVNLLHTVTGLEGAGPDAKLKAFLQQPSASRLKSVSGLSRGLVESLDAPLLWPSVELHFHPSRAHHDRLLAVEEMALRAQHEPVSAAAFGGSRDLKKLSVVRAAPGAFEPLTGLVELKVAEWTWEPRWHWASELSRLPRLRHLSVGPTATGPQLEGLQLSALTCWTSDQLDVDGLLGALPQLKALRIHCGMDPTTAMTVEKLLAAKRLQQLTFAAAGIFEFVDLGTSSARLELRAYQKHLLGRYAAVIATIPPTLVNKIVVRPARLDPWFPAGPLPFGLEAIRAAAKMPVQLAWY